MDDLTVKLVAELRKLGATVESKYGEVFVNGYNVGVSVKERGGRVTYEVGDRKFTSPRNAAYCVIAERLPEIKRLADMDALLERATAPKFGVGLPKHVYVGMMNGWAVIRGCKDADELRDVLLMMADRLTSD